MKMSDMNLESMNHAIKEQISDNKVYVEVEPQPAKPDIEVTKKENGQFWAEWGGVEWEIKPPISIGDTVNGRKVVGIEVEELEGFIELCSNDHDSPISMIALRRSEGELIPVKKWFWKYSLEEIK